MNKDQNNPVEVKKVSRYRTLASNALALSKRNCYPIATNMSFDATSLIRFAKEKQLTTNTLIAKAIADTLKEAPAFAVLNSFYQRSFFRGDRLVLYSNVDFTLALDRIFEGERVASVYVLKNVNQRELSDIDQELRVVNKLEVTDLPLYKKLKLVMMLPSWVQRVLMSLSATFAKPGNVTFGTVGLTNLGKGAMEEVFPVSPKTLIFGIGGAQAKYEYSQEIKQYQKRFVMKVNMTFNHFAVDGGICNEFLTRLKDNLEHTPQRYQAALFEKTQAKTNVAASDRTENNSKYPQ